MIWRLPSLTFLLALVACTATPPIEGPRKPPGLEAFPTQVALRCVTPGCDTIETVRVNVVGSRRVAIKRVLIEGDTAGEFSFTSSESAPFILGQNTGFDVQVQYTPSGAPITGSIELRVTYTDASPEESEDRLAAGELVIPLVRRLVGEPELVASPDVLSFGFVPNGGSSTRPVRIENQGFGNVSLEITAVDAGHDAIRTVFPARSTLPPGEHTELPVLFLPREEAYVRSRLTLESTSAELGRSSVLVEGTSIPAPQLALEPGGDLDFGELPKGKQRVLTLVLVNQGGSPLSIDDVHVADDTGNVVLEGAGGPTTLAPLQRTQLVLRINGITPSEVDATVEIASNDPTRPLLTIRLTGTITEPHVTVSPSSVDFGAVPVGWVVKRPVEIRNTGFGTLAVKNIRLVAGTSNLFTVLNVPTLPLMLARGERVAVEVEFRGETAAPFSGTLSIESNDVDTAFTEVSLQAVAGACGGSCTVANGTPTCAGGTCGVGACNANYFDTDGNASNGCECKEIGTDPGAFCPGARFAGTLVDNDGDQVTHTGVLPVNGDVDLIRFFAEDAFKTFDENFHVRVRLTSSDPDIRFCVYRRDVESHDSECFFMNESCPANRTYEKTGSGGSSDSADFIVKVYRSASAAPTCKSYTLFMSNGS